MPARITYCGNVHAAPDLDAWLAAADRYTAKIAAQRARAPGGFGLGAWFSAALAAELATDAAARARLARWLDAHGLSVWTLNVFPHGDFHAERVKLAVYEPDWASEERLEYTRHCAELAAELAPAGAVVPLSTLPLGYGAGHERKRARNLARAASLLAAASERSGRELVLALEPEPFCRCETVAATAEFLAERVFGAPDSPVGEDVLRRHLGICIDLCHLAVVGEDPLEALAACERAGIRVPKVQVSSCLELRDPAVALDALLAFDEPRYLHQTVSFDGALRALDLDEVRRRRDEFARANGLRTHFHLPIHWDADGPLGSTRRAVERCLEALGARGKSGGELPLLEVETYTWTVLDAAFRPEQDLAAGIAAELAFVDRALAT